MSSAGEETADDQPPLTEADEPDAVLREIAARLTNWAKANVPRLSLAPGKLALRGYHPVHRIASGGELLVEMVAHFVQTRDTGDEDFGGLKYRAGVTMIANIDGYVRYVIRKPFHEKRLEGMRGWVDAFDETEDRGWDNEARDPERMLTAYSARAMDGKRWR